MPRKSRKSLAMKSVRNAGSSRANDSPSANNFRVHKSQKVLTKQDAEINERRKQMSAIVKKMIFKRRDCNVECELTGMQKQIFGEWKISSAPSSSTSWNQNHASQNDAGDLSKSTLSEITPVLKSDVNQPEMLSVCDNGNHDEPEIFSASEDGNHVKILSVLQTDQYYFNPTDCEWQEANCNKLGLRLNCEVHYRGHGLPLSDQFEVRKIKGDGNCFCRSVSVALTGIEANHISIRSQIVQHEIQLHDRITPHLWVDEDIDSHIDAFAHLGTYARDSDVFATASLLGTNIYVYQKSSSGDWNWHRYDPRLFGSDENFHRRSIFLHNLNSDHFDLVTTMIVSNPSANIKSTFSRKRSYKEKLKFDQIKKRKKIDLDTESITKRKEANRCSKVKSREMESTDRTALKVKADKYYRIKHRLEENKSETAIRLKKDRERQRNQRSEENESETTVRLKKNREYIKKHRSEENESQTTVRLKQNREYIKKHRSEENESETKLRRELDKEYRKKHRSEENQSATDLRQKIDRENNRKLRSLETRLETANRLKAQSERQKKLRSYETAEKSADRLKKNRARKAQKNSDKPKTILEIKKEIDDKIHITYICISCLRYHKRALVTKVSTNDLEQNHFTQNVIMNVEENLKTEEPTTVSFDGNFYICKSCKRTLKAGRIPKCNERTFRFSVPKLPDHLVENNMALNKCEQFLLKRLIPFIRVAHIVRSNEFKVLGPVICVEADVKDTLSKIVPVKQELILVSLKRRPDYCGSYMEEVISKEKLLQYYKYFVQKNHLFEDVTFDDNSLEQFLHDCIEDVQKQDDWKKSSRNNECSSQSDKIKDSEANEDNDDSVSVNSLSEYKDNILEEDKNDEANSIDDLSDCNYDLPEFLTEISDDTVIDPITKSENPNSITDAISNAIIQREVNQAAQKSKRKFIEKVKLAPTADGKFVKWDEVDFFEEKAFPHLFPTGTGGYLSTYEPRGVTFSNYIKQRMLGVDSRFRDDTTYLFFIYTVKELYELKRSIGTFFRKGKLTNEQCNVKNMKDADKAEIIRLDAGYKVFKAVRGTAPYFQHSKNKVMGMIRQLGPPQLFVSLSAAESHWHELIKNLMQKEQSRWVHDDEIKNLTKTEINKLIARNIVDTTIHFSNRIRALFSGMKKPGLFGDYKVVDHFYRIEFQQRGAPHVHSVLWLEDSDGNPPPDYDRTRESTSACVKFIDKIICGTLPPDSDGLFEMVSFFQTHNHTFTCRKKSRKIIIRPNEGHGNQDSSKTGPEIVTDSCRFKFPKFPIHTTTIIDPPCQAMSKDELNEWKRDYVKLRKYILRQCYMNNKKFFQLSFDEFLESVGLSEERYLNALSISVMVNQSKSEVFLKRDCKDILTNNYNPNLLDVHNANIDVSFILDEYSCVAYILGYLTKNESGLSRLLRQIEVESAQFGTTPGEKLSAFRRALDNSREVSRPEAVYRMLGLHMCNTTRTHKFIQTGKPSQRDGLIRSNLDELDENDSPFYNSIYDYYVNRPDSMEHVTLAEFARDYTVVYKSKDETNADELFDMPDEVEEGTGRTLWLKNSKGRIRKTTKHNVIRYHMDKNNDVETKRTLLQLFHPFRDESREIHQKDDDEMVKLYERHKDSIEPIRKQFEPNRDLFLVIQEAVENQKSIDEEEFDNESDNEQECPDEIEETTSKEELRNFLSMASKSQELNITQREEICSMASKLNNDQRKIFDDVVERLVSQDSTMNPFYLYISGQAGTGKSFLMKSLIEAAKLVLMKSGDDLHKNSVLVLSPTAVAARLIGGETIEAGLKLFRRDDIETFEVFSNNATCAFNYDQVKVIFIDEISMVGTNKLHAIHTRCEEIFGRKELPFGGKSIICTGDFLQLTPVQDRLIFFPSKQSNIACMTVQNKWQTYFKVYNVNQKMRSINNVQFSNLCDRVGTSELQEDDINVLKQRIVVCDNENNNDSFKSGKLAIIVTDNMKCETINESKLHSLLDGDCVEFRAIDKCVNADALNQNRILDVPYTQTGGLPGSLKLKVNCPVMLTNNIGKQDGLSNGVRGYVVEIDSDKNIIWVKFHGDVGMVTSNVHRNQYKYYGPRGAVAITKMKSTFLLRNRSIRIQRTQFPLVVAYAITAHKSQGQTLDEVIVDFRNNDSNKHCRINPGSFYVAVTRVKKLENLYLKSFDASQMVKIQKDVKSELLRLKKDSNRHKFSRHFLSNAAFQYPPNMNSDEVKIVYLNINGLLASSHLHNLNHDMNMKCADVLCISETKLFHQNDSDIKLDGFTQVARLDVRENSMGMLVYTNNDSDVEAKFSMLKNELSDMLQIVQCDINDYSVSFVYTHPSVVKRGLNQISNNIRPNEIIMGDLNIDYLNNQTRNVLLEFCERHHLAISDHGPTRNDSQIDHILVPLSHKSHYCTSTFYNFYSDHRAISVRLSKNATSVLV